MIHTHQGKGAICVCFRNKSILTRGFENRLRHFKLWQQALVLYLLLFIGLNVVVEY